MSLGPFPLMGAPHAWSETVLPVDRRSHRGHQDERDGNSAEGLCPQAATLRSM
jgi:hypothetical protein